ncbi:hypothetical protein [Propionivibrio sp.]|uniref:hypothetical protein n=1 Tax=Propionivibrio sp. TaxID=2212460 RepID=UPI0025CE4FA0|nr:hypothetical protein [Propionivibrio sp.]MBK8746044.1 hypothetical protein [Propionivibrio sp.]
MRSLRRRVARRARILLDLSIVLLLVLVVLVGYRYAPRLLPTTDLTLAPVTDCDLNKQSCSVGIPAGGRIELNISPHPIPVSKPLHVSARIAGFSANRIEIDLSGENMNMGYNRWPLIHDGNDAYLGDATLPVCITGRMIWRATLIVETDRQRMAIPFLFEAPVH